VPVIVVFGSDDCRAAGPSSAVGDGRGLRDDVVGELNGGLDLLGQLLDAPADRGEPRRGGGRAEHGRPGERLASLADRIVRGMAGRGEVVDPERMLAEMVDDAADLAEVENPL
jgi:hypothetical protein